MNNNLAKVYHYDLYGKRNNKYDFLNNNSINSVDWQELEYKEPHYFFVPKDFEIQETYDRGFKIEDLFNHYTSGVKTHNDKELVSFTKFENEYNKKYSYKPFDTRFINYNLKEVVRHRYNSVKHMFLPNYSIILMRSLVDQLILNSVFVSHDISDINFYRFQTYLFPLYLYSDDNEEPTREPNLNMEIVNKIAEGLGLEFVPEKFPSKDLTTPPTLQTQATPFTSSTPPNLPKGEALRDDGATSSPPLEEVEEVGKESQISSPPLEEIEEVKKDKYSGKPRYITANPKIYKLIKDVRMSLKNNPTKAEKILWEFLRNKKIGHKIRRQHIIDQFITDFVCLSKKVVIEIDGKIHDFQQDYDEIRTARLKELDYEVIRFTNDDVINKPEDVAMQIKEYLDEKELDENSNASTLPKPSTPPNLPKGKALRNDGALGSPPLEESEEFGKESQISSPPLEESEEVGKCSQIGSPPLEELEEVVKLNTFAPIDILDYIYAVLHSPAYREKYKEFLKIDFPRVLYPKDADTFWKLVEIGKEIREIHLLESPKVEQFITSYPKNGNNIITTKIGKKDWELTDPEKGIGRIWINADQYFDNIPLIAWEFYIGGYQPAQKWLKDRKDRELSFEDILHYQKIIVALTETNRLMKLIDKILII